MGVLLLSRVLPQHHRDQLGPEQHGGRGGTGVEGVAVTLWFEQCEGGGGGGGSGKVTSTKFKLKGGETMRSLTPVRIIQTANLIQKYYLWCFSGSSFCFLSEPRK